EGAEALAGFPHEGTNPLKCGNTALSAAARFEGRRRDRSGRHAAAAAFRGALARAGATRGPSAPGRSVPSACSAHDDICVIEQAKLSRLGVQWGHRYLDRWRGTR